MPSGERLARALVLAFAGVAAAAAIWTGSAAFAGDEVLVLCASALVAELLLATAALAPAQLARSPVRETLGLGPGALTRRDLLLLVAGTLAASHALDGALELSGLARDGALLEVPRMLEGTSGLRLAIALLAIGVAPGLAEELFCRGLIQRAVTRRCGPGVGIVVAASAFGALHLEPVHATFATILGLYLGAAAHWAGSVRPAMVCHVANNLAAVALAAAGSSWTSPPSVALAGPLALACLWAVGRRRRRDLGPGLPEPNGASGGAAGAPDADPATCSPTGRPEARPGTGIPPGQP